MHCGCGLGSLQYLTPWVGMCSSLVGVKRVLESSTRTLYKEMVAQALFPLFFHSNQRRTHTMLLRSNRLGTNWPIISKQEVSQQERNSAKL